MVRLLVEPAPRRRRVYVGSLDDAFLAVEAVRTKV